MQNFITKGGDVFFEYNVLLQKYKCDRSSERKTFKEGQKENKLRTNQEDQEEKIKKQKWENGARKQGKITKEQKGSSNSIGPFFKRGIMLSVFTSCLHRSAVFIFFHLFVLCFISSLFVPRSFVSAPLVLGGRSGVPPSGWRVWWMKRLQNGLLSFRINELRWAAAAADGSALRSFINQHGDAALAGVQVFTGTWD